MLNPIAKTKRYLQQKHRGTILSFFTFVIGWVVGLKISVIIGAYLILIAIPLLIYWIMSGHKIRHKIIKIFKRPSNKNRGKKLYTLLTISLMIISFIIIRFPFWSNTLLFLMPERGQDYNPYVTQTSKYEDGQYSLLVEFGARTYDINHIDIAINIGNEWDGLIEKWWDIPYQTSKSIDAVAPFNSDIWIAAGTTGWSNKTQPNGVWLQGNAIQIYEDATHPPIYRSVIGGVSIAFNRSLYMYFKSSKPLDIKAVRINDTVFHSIDGKMIPY